MKKSTLITTIAMIVVVVVALSTATYAWFSSSTSTQTTQTIETVGQSGITVLTNSVVFEGTSTPAVFDATALLSGTYKNASVVQDGLRAGLWAPVKEIAAATTENKNAIYPTANTATSTNVGGGLVSFISGTEKGDVFEIETPSKAMSPDMVRVTNNTESSIAHLYLNIYISAAANLNSYYAAQGVSTVVIAYNSDSAGTLKANTQYGFLKHNAALDTDTNGESGEDAHDTYSKTEDFGAVSSATGFAAAGTAINHRSLETKDPGYGWSGNAVNETNISSTDIRGSLVSGGAFYCLSVEIASSVAVGSSINILLYTWLDGAYLNDAASQAQIAIVYTFADHAVGANGATV